MSRSRAGSIELCHFNIGGNNAHARSRNYDGWNPTTALAPASAASFVEDFTISVSGEADQNFLSSPFALFDPKLGTLLSVNESVSGSLTWEFGNDTGDTLLLASGKTGASQFFLSSGPAVLKTSP